MVKRRKPGRPPKGGETKTEWISTRVTAALANRLDQAVAKRASAEGRVVTISDEIQARLAKTFQDEDMKAGVLALFGNRRNNAALCVLLIELIKRIEAESGKPWYEDRWTCDQLESGLHEILHNWTEGPSKKPKSKTYSPAAMARLGRVVARDLLIGTFFSEGNATFKQIRAWLGWDDLFPSEREKLI